MALSLASQEHVFQRDGNFYKLIILWEFMALSVVREHNESTPYNPRIMCHLFHLC